MGALRRAVRSVATTCFPQLWGRAIAWRSARAERRHWNERIADVLACPDNARLARVADAGRIFGGYQVMHNGIKVAVDGYYGDGITRMLQANRGCHEPQEEVVFDAILESLPTGATMVELGAYWGFYSLWFLREVSEATVYLVEPAAANLVIGQRNFELNDSRGDFTNAYIGARPGVAEDGTKVVSIESYCAEKGLKRVDLLHSDVQGYELEMLEGARALLAAHRIDYLFISTHGKALHASCEAHLRGFGYRALVSVDVDETYSVDGVLVACSPLATPPEFSPPSKRSSRSGVSLE